MKETKQPPHFRMDVKVLLMMLVFTALVSGCMDDNDSNTLKKDSTISSNAGRSAAGNSNSQSNSGDYTIELSVVGSIWTYVITKNPGAKDLSHFILNFQNCGTSSATLSNILWATVNGKPAKLSNSEGNTGCNVNDVTTNFIKFDNLPSALSYTIVFEMNGVFGNFVGTTAWLKAGNSCIAYSVLAPCCLL
jgi:hypothetical protein